MIKPWVPQKVNLETINKNLKIKKHKKAIPISNTTPPIHIPKHNTKTPQSIPRSRILIIFEISHLTSCLVKV